MPAAFFRLKAEATSREWRSPLGLRAAATSNCSAQLVGTNRQPIDALAGRRGDGVDQRTGGERRARFANAARLLRARHDEHVDLWRFVVPHHRVVVEVALRDSAILDGDLAPQCRRQAVDGAAFHLGLDRVWVDDPPTVHGAPNLVNAYVSVRDGNFRNLTDDAAERLHQRDPSGTALRHGLAPTRLVGDELQHGLVPGMLA